MNCPSCGAALPDGALFCGNCGSQIQGGAQPQQQPQMQQPQMQQFQQQSQFQQQFQQGMMQQGFQPNGMYMQAQPSQAGIAFADMWKLFAEGITRPFTAAKSVVERGRGLAGFLIAIFMAVVVFFLLLIHLPFGNYASTSYYGFSISTYSVGYRALQAFLTVLVMTAIFMLTALAGYIFRDKSKPQYSYMNIMGMLGSTLVYPLFAVGLQFIFGLFSAPMASAVECGALIIWSCFSTVILREVIGGTEEAKTVKSVFSVAVIICGLSLLVALIEMASKTSVGILL